MAKKNGNLDFDSDNYLLFIVNGTEDEEDEAGETSHMMEWASTPREFAKRLRAAADWLEAHATDDIHCNID